MSLDVMSFSTVHLDCKIMFHVGRADFAYLFKYRPARVAKAQVATTRLPSMSKLIEL